MQIYNLIENTPGVEGCQFEHGLSFYFATAKHRVLLDSGAGNAFLDNAKLLSVKLDTVDVMVLSHGHYDHAGGILGFADCNSRADIYMQKKAAGEYYGENPEGPHYIGIDKKILDLKQLKLMEGDYRIDEELSVFAGVTGRRGFSKSNLRLKELKDGRLVQDQFEHEQYLVVEQDNKKYLFSGCAHNGILNIIDRFRELYHCVPDVVLSGFHYMKKSEYTEDEIQIITDTARELSTYETVFYTCHCTGEKAFELMKPIMGDKLKSIHSGNVITI